MAKYHITNKGEVYPCRARKGRCPFGGETGEENHFETAYEARSQYEKDNKGLELMNSITRNDFNYSPFNSEGLTPNMIAFRQDLHNVNKAIEIYQDYRTTGQDDPSLIPDTPSHLSRYIDEDLLHYDWLAEDYQAVRGQFADAIKKYYNDSVFEPEDIDCLFDDDDIETFINSSR